jgi:hypothetical protein
MQALLAKHGMTVEDITTMYTMFTTYQVRETLLSGKARTAGND